MEDQSRTSDLGKFREKKDKTPFFGISQHCFHLLSPANYCADEGKPPSLLGQRTVQNRSNAEKFPKP